MQFCNCLFIYVLALEIKLSRVGVGVAIPSTGATSAGFRKNEALS